MPIFDFAMTIQIIIEKIPYNLKEYTDKNSNKLPKLPRISF